MQSVERDEGRPTRGPEDERRMGAAPRREYARRIDCGEGDRRAGALNEGGRGRGAPLPGKPGGGARRLD